MAKKRTPSAESLKERVITIVRSRKQNIGDVERELKKLYQDYFARVRDHLGRELSRSEQLNIKATTEMMRSLTDMLDEAGKPDVLKSYREKFNGLADDALSYFSAFGESTSKAGVSREAIKAYSKFAETELAKSIDAKLVGPIQSALLQANYGSYTRAQLVDNLKTIEPTLTTTSAVVLVDDAFSQFQRAIIVEKGDAVDLDIYQYLGPDDDITSPQCQHMLHVDMHGAEGILYKDEISADLHENLRQNPLIAGGHPRCFLPGTMVYGKILKALKSFYSGEAITINTAKGHSLSVTPNHPILTARGFVPAALLNPGDKVVSYNRDVESSVSAALSIERNEYDRPARVEDIFDSILSKGSLVSRVHPSPLDLHGDAQPWNGDIDIVEMNRILPLNSEPVTLKSDCKNVLGGVGVCCPSPLAEGLFNLGINVKNATPTSGPSAPQLPLHKGRVSLDTPPLQTLTLGSGAFFDSAFSQYALGSSLSDAVLPSQLRDRFPVEILFDEILDIRRHPYSGHVYDLESTTGWLIADGVCASNCRHQWTPVTLDYAVSLGFEPR